MEIRLQCYDNEKDAAVAGIESAFDVKSVSKGYPNMRQTSVQGTPSETRYYIKLNGVRKAPLADALVMDMLRFLSMLNKAYGIDINPEINRLRVFYDNAGHLTGTQQLELASEWRAAVLGRCLAGRGR